MSDIATSHARHLPLDHRISLALSDSFHPHAIVQFAPWLPVHQLFGLLSKWCRSGVWHSCCKPSHEVLVRWSSCHRCKCEAHRCSCTVNVPWRLWWSRHLAWDRRLWSKAPATTSLACAAPTASKQALSTGDVALSRILAATFACYDAVQAFWM